MSSALELVNFGLNIGPRKILRDVSFVVPDRGVVTLMGPGGAGKSSLLRALTEHADHPSFEKLGDAVVSGLPIGGLSRGVLVRQRLDSAAMPAIEVCAQELPNRSSLTQPEQRELIAKQLVRLCGDSLVDSLDSKLCDLPNHEQRILRIVAATLGMPRLLCVDEPTAELEEDDALDVLDVLAKVADDTGVLLITHNQRHAKLISDYVGLLAGGRLIEFGPADQFFYAPARETTRAYLRTGGCSTPSLNAKPEELDDSAEFDRPEAPVVNTSHDRPAVSESAGPRGFRWLVPGSLGGSAYPGIVADLRHDLEALERVGANVLINLTEEPATYLTELAAFGIDSRFFPIDDMGAPALESAAEICAEVADLVSQGCVVVFHCKAGLGRTGTMLAAQAVFDGATAPDALQAVRRAHARWVQSKTQEEFLEHFAQFLRGSERRTIAEYKPDTPERS